MNTKDKKDIARKLEGTSFQNYEVSGRSLMGGKCPNSECSGIMVILKSNVGRKIDYCVGCGYSQERRPLYADPVSGF